MASTGEGGGGGVLSLLEAGGHFEHTPHATSHSKAQSHPEEAAHEIAPSQAQSVHMQHATPHTQTQTLTQRNQRDAAGEQTHRPSSSEDISNVHAHVHSSNAHAASPIQDTYAVVGSGNANAHSMSQKQIHASDSIPQVPASHTKQQQQQQQHQHVGKNTHAKAKAGPTAGFNGSTNAVNPTHTVPHNAHGDANVEMLMDMQSGGFHTNATKKSQGSGTNANASHSTNGKAHANTKMNTPAHQSQHTQHMQHVQYTNTNANTNSNTHERASVSYQDSGVAVPSHADNERDDDIRAHYNAVHTSAGNTARAHPHAHTQAPNMYHTQGQPIHHTQGPAYAYGQQQRPQSHMQQAGMHNTHPHQAHPPPPQQHNQQQLVQQQQLAAHIMIQPSYSSETYDVNKRSNIIAQWLIQNYESADEQSLPRQVVYEQYENYCASHNREPINAASFGKHIRAIFPNLKTRRLGTRGNSKYHYYGIRIRPASELYGQVLVDYDGSSASHSNRNSVTKHSNRYSVTSDEGGFHDGLLSHTQSYGMEAASRTHSGREFAAHTGGSKARHGKTKPAAGSYQVLELPLPPFPTISEFANMRVPDVRDMAERNETESMSSELVSGSTGRNHLADDSSTAGGAIAEPAGTSSGLAARTASTTGVEAGSVNAGRSDTTRPSEPLDGMIKGDCMDVSKGANANGGTLGDNSVHSTASGIAPVNKVEEGSSRLGQQETPQTHKQQIPDGNSGLDGTSIPSRSSTNEPANTQHISKNNTRTQQIPGLRPPVLATYQMAENLETTKFIALFRGHCETLLHTLQNLTFDQPEPSFYTMASVIHVFWKELSLGSLRVASSAECCAYIYRCDSILYETALRSLLPDVLGKISPAVTKSIRLLAKQVDSWLKTALANAGTANTNAHNADKIKIEQGIGSAESNPVLESAGIDLTMVLAARRRALNVFTHALRRHTSLNHLIQAARSVLTNKQQVVQMLDDWCRIDKKSMREQAVAVCGCDETVMLSIESEFEAILGAEAAVETWTLWLGHVIDRTLGDPASEAYYKSSRRFLTVWSFMSTLFVRDLTLRSAKSFGSFHLMRLLLDEFSTYLIERRHTLCVCAPPYPCPDPFPPATAGSEHDNDGTRPPPAQNPNGSHKQLSEEIVVNGNFQSTVKRKRKISEDHHQARSHSAATQSQPRAPSRNTKLQAAKTVQPTSLYRTATQMQHSGPVHDLQSTTISQIHPDMHAQAPKRPRMTPLDAHTRSNMQPSIHTQPELQPQQNTNLTSADTHAGESGSNATELSTNNKSSELNNQDDNTMRQRLETR